MRSLILAVCLMAGTVLAGPRESLVVDANWLAKHIHDPNLVLLHIGDKAEYEATHIAGARYVSLQDISRPTDMERGDLHLEMPAPEELRERLQNLGISNDSRVIAYYGKDWVSPTTRVMLTLDYAGLGDRASLLDGGMPAWVAAGQPTTAEASAAKKGTLAPLKIKPAVIVTGDQVRAAMGKKGTVIIDGRSPAFYDGTDTGGMHDRPHKTGHIAGAASVPFTEVVNDQNVWKSPEELKALFAKAGVKPGDKVIGYCHIGQQATAMLFAARSLGHEVALYDGSFEDWSRRADGPVEGPAPKKEQK
ncbi:MAG TPA: sulfurtransferase [Thermoanaerobaculia bacterium]|nr:sulfurtransferase [Thermoanaerobaculia bacterium]